MATPVARNFYDVVVVGASLGALASGALLARRGFRVAWIRQGERPQAYAYGGAALLRSAPALSFAEGPAFRRVVAELALGPVLRRRVSVTEPPFQVALPGHRVDVRAAPDAWIAELAREFPEVRRPMEDFLARVGHLMTALDAVQGADLAWPPVGFFERRDAARVLARASLDRRAALPDPLADFPADHPFRTFVLAQARFATALDPDALTALQVLRAHGCAARGATRVEGGRDALSRLLQEKIALHGGDARPRDSAARIVVSRGRVRGVDLAGTDERLGCNFVLTSLDGAAAVSLAEHRPSRALAELLAQRAPRYYRYVLNVVARADGVPTGMGPRVFAVMDRARPLCEENLLQVDTSPADAQGRALFTVTALLPRSGVEEGESYLRRQRERVLRALDALVPFLRRNLIYVDSPHDGLALEDHALGVEVTLDDRWNGAPEPMEPLEAAAPDGFLGVCTLPSRTEVRGLLLVGRQVVAGLGDEGELLAALTAARIVTRTDRLKEQMRRELYRRIEA